jgi:hypothetical protein
MEVPAFKSFIDEPYDDDISPIPIYQSPVNHKRPTLEVEVEEELSFKNESLEDQ